MKLTRNSLKELIRQSIKEIDFEDEEAFKKYQSQHKMRPDTKVNIGGKDTTVGQASGDEGGDGSELKNKYDAIFKDEKQIDKMFSNLKTQGDAVKLAEELGNYSKELASEVNEKQNKQVISIIGDMAGSAKEAWSNAKPDEIVQGLVQPIEQHGVDAVVQSMANEGAIESGKEDAVKSKLEQMTSDGEQAGRAIGAIAVGINALQELHKQLPESVNESVSRKITRNSLKELIRQSILVLMMYLILMMKKVLVVGMMMLKVVQNLEMIGIKIQL